MARELFKGFLTLDGITLFATCKVRRIFTMKEEPPAMSTDGNIFACLLKLSVVQHILHNAKSSLEVFTLVVFQNVM